MRLASGLAALAALAACGDDLPGSLCGPAPRPLAATGPVKDPLAPPLAGCVEGGLADLPGRWFVAAEGAGFAFDYPRFEGNCETGIRRAFRDDDLDASD